MKLKSLLLFFSIFLFSNTLMASANESQTIDLLADEDIAILINSVGLTESEINEFPVEVLQQLINNNAKKIYFNQEHLVLDENNKLNNISPFVEKDTDITVGAAAFEVNSDRVGQKKIYVYGNFNWLKSPPSRWTDALSIGWPDSAELSFPINNRGDIAQYEAKYFYRDGPYSAFGWQTGKSVTQPDDYASLAGVGFRFNLKSGFGFTEHKGYVGQYLYTKKPSGLFNILVRYGHYSISFSPSFTVYPSMGLAVTPVIRNTTLNSYAILNW
ncbi:hypothetical protein [Metasolibacillus sp. FSL K6-0083]|uniref:hypothetical protein n=1 Tax=Metasolibacillus sp. FSL K6-0083 TaxID=2921416 RepID=UPI00315AC91A